MRKIISLLLLLFLGGCAISGQSLKDHNLINMFYAKKDYHKVGKKIADMSNFCESGVYIVEYKNMDSIKKSVVDLKGRYANYYYMHVEIEGVGENESKISVYHYMNTKVTRNMGQAIESWVNADSKECVSGF